MEKFETIERKIKPIEKPWPKYGYKKFSDDNYDPHMNIDMSYRNSRFINDLSWDINDLIAKKEKGDKIEWEDISELINRSESHRNKVIDDAIYYYKDAHVDFKECLDKLSELTKQVKDDYTNDSMYDYTNDRVNNLLEKVEKDLIYLDGYSKERLEKYENYIAKVSAYDKLSIFGKIAAIFNGQEKELDKAFYDYRAGGIRTDGPNDGERAHYVEYIEKQMGGRGL